MMRSRTLDPRGLLRGRLPLALACVAAIAGLGGGSAKGQSGTTTGAAPGAAPAPVEPEKAPIAVLRPPSDLGQNRVTHDRAYRAIGHRDYATAVKDFEKLANEQPEVLEYRLNFALCLYELRRFDDAQAKYEAILSSEPDNVIALLAVARIHAARAQGMGPKDPARQELLDQAKDSLRHAARYGLNALRAVKVYPEFAAFKTDVLLALDLIREPQTLRLDSPLGRDPFYNPLPTKLEPTAGPGPIVEERGALSAAEQEALVKRLEALFAEIDPIVERGDYDALSRKWAEIAEIMAQQNKVTALGLVPKFNELVKRHHEKRQVIKSLLLKAFFAEGEKIVESMRVADGEHDFRTVFELWDRLQAHAKKMRETDEKFVQTATDLLTDARPLVERAEILRQIDQIKLEVTGIVTVGGLAHGIVNNRIVSEGDVVFDPSGNPITELRVIQIKKGRIRFEFRGLEFEPRKQLKRY